MKNQNGFTLVAGLLLVIAVTLIGFTGFYVYNANKKNDQIKINEANPLQPTSENKDAAQATQDITAEWKTFSSSDGKFSLKYPSNWLHPEGGDFCGGTSFLAGTSEDSRGICQSDAPVQIHVTSIEGDQAVAFAPKAGESPGLTVSDATIAGVKGKKYVHKVGMNYLLSEDTQLTQYILYKAGRTYIAIYSDGAGKYKSAEADFDLMVNKTLKLTP